GKGDQAFDGNTVYTLKNNKPNKILKVSDESLKRDSENDSPTQTIPKEVFKIVYNHVIEKGQITRVEINAALPHRYSSIGYNGDIDPSARSEAHTSELQ